MCFEGQIDALGSLTFCMWLQKMLPLFALFSGEPPFGVPHVNPTVETWGAGDYTKVNHEYHDLTLI